MRINHNIAALNTYRQLTGNVNGTSKSLEKLSSGLRINKAGDDAAGLAISEKMRAQIRGLDQASRNASDAISLIQTAEGALTETHSVLQRMRELAVQSATDTNTNDDRKEIQKEVNNLLEEIDRISQKTEFNTQRLLDGTYGQGEDGEKNFHIGANKSDTLKASISDMGAEALGVDILTQDVDGSEGAGGAGGVEIAFDGTAPTGVSDLAVAEGVAEGDYSITASENSGEYTFTVTIDGNVETATVTPPADDSGDPVTVTLGGISFDVDHEYAGGEIKVSVTATENNEGDNNVESPSEEAPANGVLSRDSADKAIKTIDEAIAKVSSERAKLGGIQNRLEHTINNLGATSENLSASESRVRDVDMAKEMMEFTKNNILSQASQAMLAQANMQPQSVLQLLQ